MLVIFQKGTGSTLPADVLPCTLRCDREPGFRPLIYLIFTNLLFVSIRMIRGCICLCFRYCTQFNAEGTTIVMVTHCQHDAAYENCTINLFDGEVVENTIL